MEVIPNFTVDDNSGVGILHVCGGHPKRTGVLVGGHQYSPRMWRSSYADLQPQSTFQVFSTYVEVILFAAEFGTVCAGILHVCGGHPLANVVGVCMSKYSPRMWRSSCISLSIP